jgi:nucleotide-binding universal stress UspA family protein
VADVLACVDFSDLTPRVVALASSLARAFGDRLHILHVAAGEPELAGYDKDDISSFTRDDRAHELEGERSSVQALAEPLESTGIDVVAHVTMGHTTERIVQYAEAHQVEFIVVGTHGHGGLRHLLLGSVTESLVRTSPVAVVVVPARAESRAS